MSGDTSVVCVLGMLRTGTSLVGRILNLLGVYLGPADELLPPNRANPAGFWEHRGIIALNDDLLARLGGSWHAPPPPAPGWESDASLDDLRDRARALVHSQFSGRPLWGWKDPRTCLTLPFWRSLASPTSHVVCLRNPREAARSLASMPWVQRRVSDPVRQGLDLWLEYTRRALEHTRRRRRLLVFYEDLLAGPRDEVSRLASFIGRADALESADVQRAIEEFIQPALRHQEEPVSLGRHPAERLYARLRRRSMQARGSEAIRRRADRR